MRFVACALVQSPGHSPHGASHVVPQQLRKCPRKCIPAGREAKGPEQEKVPQFRGNLRPAVVMG